MKRQRNKKCLYNHKSINGIKIIAHTFIELTYKVLKIALAERLSEDSLGTYFSKQHPPGAWKI